MKKNKADYEQGEYILLLFLPGYLLLICLLYLLQVRTFFFTNNMVTLLGLGLLGVLLLGLALLYRGIRDVPPQRLHTTDWHLSILLAFFLLISVLGVVAQVWNMVHMLFLSTGLGAYLRQHFGYMEMFLYVMNAACVAVGAGIWLCGVHKKRVQWALCGAALFTLLILQGEATNFPRGGMMELSVRLALQATQSPDNGDAGMHESTSAENNDEENTMRRLYLGGDKTTPLFWGMHTVVRFYFIVLLCFTFVRWRRQDMMLCLPVNHEKRGGSGCVIGQIGRIGPIIFSSML